MLSLKKITLQVACLCLPTTIDLTHVVVPRHSSVPRFSIDVEKLAWKDRNATLRKPNRNSHILNHHNIDDESDGAYLTLFRTEFQTEKENERSPSVSYSVQVY